MKCYFTIFILFICNTIFFWNNDKLDTVRLLKLIWKMYINYYILCIIIIFNRMTLVMVPWWWRYGVELYWEMSKYYYNRFIDETDRVYEPNRNLICETLFKVFDLSIQSDRCTMRNEAVAPPSTANARRIYL